jgi:hypothetical protein
MDVPFHAAGIWRTGRGRYRGRLVEIPVVREGSRRERMVGTLTNEARAFEELISQAPEQWTAIFFPIWPDLEAGTAAAEDGGAEPASGSTGNGNGHASAAAAAASMPEVVR